jgi:ABC-type uncharacterized transport system ATPase subunit
MGDFILQAKNITKRFPGVLANDHINFNLKKGEIHTLLGENGAGKSTLMNILDGIYYPNEGEIYINGEKANIRSPFDAMKYGIGMIHQHFMLVDTLTVLENIILGLKDQKFVINKKEVADKILEISNKYNFDLKPFAKIWQLSVGEQQRVEIVKMLFRGANILILDEPTAVLTPQESEALFDILKKMKSEGKSIIFISHKLNEVMAISDRITVLRKGKLIGTVNKKDITQKDLAKMMVGREVLFRLERKPLKEGKEILKVDSVEAYNDRGIKVLNKISFSVHSGEIFGLAGVAGNGQKELAQVITGLRKVSSGKIYLNGKDITNKHPLHISNNGVNYIPPDRLKVGLVPNLSSIENAILRIYRREPVGRNGFVDYKKAREFTEGLIEKYNIMVPRIDAPVKLLSGGNMQKLLLAREITESPSLLIAVHPTRGLDVGATEFIRKKLLEVRDMGMAVLLISEDLDEIMMISDTIGVIYEGCITGIVNAKEADVHKLGLLMAGATKEAEAVS